MRDRNRLFYFFSNYKFKTFKLKVFADDTNILDGNGGKFYKKGRKHCGKTKTCSLRAISSFLIVFSNDFNCRNVITMACLGTGKQTER